MLIDKDRLYINTFLALFWVRALIGFIADETGAHGISSAVILLYDAGTIVLGVLTLKKRQDIIFLVSFLAVGYWITCVHNGYSLFFFCNGLRDFIYIIFLIPIFRYFYSTSSRSELFQSKFDKTLYIFLWVQVFCVVWQFLKYGANDHGGGSLGNGFSGAISTLIYLTSFYLMKRRTVGSTDYFANLSNNKDLLFLLIPTFLNETKISFIFLMLYFILLIPIDRKIIVRLSVGVPLLGVLFYFAMMGYVSATGNEDDIMSLEYYTEMYVFADDLDNVLDWAEYLYETDEDALTDIPRFSKFVILPDLNAEYPGHDITGYGVGQFKGGTIVEASDFYTENEWLLRGSVPYSFHMYIQLGLIGFIFLIWFWYNAFSQKPKNFRTEKGAVVFCVFINVLILFYNDTLRFVFIDMIIYYVLFQALFGGLSQKEESENGTRRLEAKSN